MKILDGQLQKTAYVAGDAFSYGDIPVGVMVYRYVNLMPDRPPMSGLDRWYAALEKRPPFRQHVTAIALA
jgi:glutathione S-transferase